MRALRQTIVVGWLLVSSACGGTEPSAEPQWQVVFEHAPGALLRVVGTSARDVLVVGADINGSGPTALHFDGSRWKRLHLGMTGSLWWSFPIGADDYRVAGDGGQTGRLKPSTGEWQLSRAPSDERLFGVWGSSAADVWMVGGQTGRNRGVLWHDEGSGPKAIEGGPAATSSAALFKAQGVGDDTIWFVGQSGLLLRKDRSGFEQFPALTNYPLMGLHGIATDRVYAVGGAAGGVLLGFDGTRWKDESPPDLPQLISVWTVDREEAWAAGFNGSAYHRKGGVWEEVKPRLPTYVDIHSIWADGEGGVWMAGGRLALDPPTDGVLLHYGKPIPNALED